MRINKKAAIFAWLSPVFFWGTYFVLAEQRPEYSLFTKAVSELGSVEVPHAWVWNVFGYLLPGILISVFSIGLHRQFKGDIKANRAFAGILLSGLLMVFSGVFPGDFENRNSLTMLLHTIGSFGSYAFFLLGAFTYEGILKQKCEWRDISALAKTFVWLTIVFGAWPLLFPQIPAVGQRLVFAFYFAWMVLVACRLYKVDEVRNSRM